MPSKRERKQQRKAMVREHERARRRASTLSLLGVLAGSAALLAGLVALVVVSDVGDGPAPPAWLVLVTGVAAFVLAGALLARRRTVEEAKKRDGSIGAAGPAAVGVGLLATQGLATWGSGDSASIAALVTALLVPFAAILVVRALLPASAMRSTGDGDAVASADAALRILD